jgi:alcohol dehydrogenase (cytochrome c)
MTMKQQGGSRFSAATSVILGGALAVAISLPALGEADVTQQRLENADWEPQNWLTIFQNYSSWHYSGLNQINRDNVANLKVAFTTPLSSALVGATTRVNLENAPLVDDGFAYLDDAWGGIYKIDLHPGNAGVVVWFADAAISKDESARTRGMAMWGDKVYKDMVDGRVIAVNRETGEFEWDLQVARSPRPESVVGALTTLELLKGEQFTAAPLAVEGKILVGQAFGDRANRGWLQAMDWETGDEIWRTYTVPGPGEPGHETWKDEYNAWKTGGASLWTTGSYDVGTRTTLWGTGNAIPQIDVEYRPGDNLYSAAVVAFDIDTGEIVWHFQYAPNEGWDYDENGVHLLFDTVIDGKERKVVGHYARNGYYYQLDRTNGDFIFGTQYTDELTWTAGLDPKTGMPVEYDPNLDIQVYIPETRWFRTEEMFTACPTALGGVRWQPTSYDPRTQIAYAAGTDGCSDGRAIRSYPVLNDVPGEQPGVGQGQALGGIIARGEEVPQVPGEVVHDGWHGGKHVNNPGTHGVLVGIDVRTGKQTAKNHLKYDNASGATATAGDLVWTGNLDGAVAAYDSETLAELWRFNTRISIKAPVMSYAVGGKQYIAIIAGGQAAPGGYGLYPELATMGLGAMLYVFSL